MTDAARERFERWMSEDWKWPDAVARRYGHYVLAHTESAWKAWQAALSEQPCEPDMRHPKIQALIGSNARRSIELSLVEQQLLEDLTAAHPAPVERVQLSEEDIRHCANVAHGRGPNTVDTLSDFSIAFAHAIIAEYERANGIGKGEQA